MVKKTTKKARKRRSFFEPDSPVLANWLQEQNDLGVSLQLIIVDAIRNYGDGDVIQAFLKARENVSGEPPITSSIPSPKAAQATPAPAKQAPVPTVAPQVPTELPIEPQAQPVIEPTPQPTEVNPVDVLTSSAEADEYDPIKIMMEDIGSVQR